jgi:hypothetical protein
MALEPMANMHPPVTAGLLAFGVSCFFIAKRVYGIV